MASITTNRDIQSSSPMISELTGIVDPLTGLSDNLKYVVARALSDKTITTKDAHSLTQCTNAELPYLSRAASMIRERGKGKNITFSPKVFIPLTRLCRDFCRYCTFRQNPSEAHTIYMSHEDVLNIAKTGERLGCTEALFTLGERPEQRYPEARNWLRRNGHNTTLEYLRDVCALVLRETSLLPHANPGTMNQKEMKLLREVNASMGLMLETSSDRLCSVGEPHELAPSKRPRVRLKTIRAAGELKVAFTSGILIGIGETLHERIDSILALRDLHVEYGHIQEIIIQNFRAKLNTPMSNHKDPIIEDLLWTVAACRLLMGPSANIQVPPNLTLDEYPALLLAGINDWGGISPLTIDYVNPEAPWPMISALEQNTRAMGFQLKPRLPLYPEYIIDKTDFIPTNLLAPILSMSDEQGFAKGGYKRHAVPSS